METFDQLPLKATLLRAVKDMGYEKPSPIQAQALPILLGDNTDFIGLAATGTGKTAAFALPMLEKIDPAAKGVQAIILCPTRELCVQVAGQVTLLGKYLNVRALPIYGGAAYDEQLRGLRKGVSVVVGTPGRVIDHINRGTLKLADVKIAIMDEADEMISMGFREDMETILAGVPRATSNIWLFSATMGGAVRRVADDFLQSPKQVQVNRTEMLSSTVEQYFYMTQEKNKPEVLCKLIDAADDFYGVIFCQMKALVVDLTRYLSERGYKAEGLQGDMSQGALEATMNAFRQRRVKILVCTDVASRGIDVKDITHVVNFSLPRELDNYVHRIGRTARSGKTGIAMSLVTPSHRHLLTKIERMTKSRMQEGVVPTRRSIGIKKIAQMIPQFTESPVWESALELMDEQWKTAVAGMKPEEVAARFLAMAYPYVFAEKDAYRPQMTGAGPGAGPKQGQQHQKPYQKQNQYSGGHSSVGGNGAGGPARPRVRPIPVAEQTAASGADAGASTAEGSPVVAREAGAARPSSADRKTEYRDQKRKFKRDFKKKFVKGFHHKKKFSSAGGDAPPRRRPND
jgi:ATP-dependent RNA helicase DeaD